MCVCCRDYVPATGGTSVRGRGASSWSQTGGVGAPGLEPVGSQHQLLEPVRIFNLQPLGREQGVFPKPATGGTEVSEANEGPNADSWSGTAGRSPCAWCRLRVSVPPPNWVCGGCAYVFTDKLQAGPDSECQVGRGAVPVLEGSANVHVLVNLESVVCAALVTFCLCQPKRRRGRGCLSLCLVGVLYVAICVSGRVSVCLWDTAQFLY